MNRSYYLCAVRDEETHREFVDAECLVEKINECLLDGYMKVTAEVEAPQVKE